MVTRSWLWVMKTSSLFRLQKKEQDKLSRQIAQGWSVAVEIPLNRGHICFVLSKSILSGLRVKENDANYAFWKVGFLIKCQSYCKQDEDTGVGVYRRCWLVDSLMTNQDIPYIIFPNNSFQMARSYRLSVSLCFTSSCLGVQSWLSVMIFFRGKKGIWEA